MNITEKENQRRLNAYEKHPSDRAASRALKMDDTVFRAWRLVRKLPAKARVGRPAKV